MLFEEGDRHVTAEQLHSEAQSLNIRVSLATVYNTLHQFTDAKLLREVVVDPGRSYFDTNTADHHHFFHEKERLPDGYSRRHTERCKTSGNPRGHRSGPRRRDRSAQRSV